ncbi:MAG: Ger(x)C family spore germination protein [Clostridia bacterium]|nr:Ger(x)C family spore germination protein [Clostridia bacterium]
MNYIKKSIIIIITLSLLLLCGCQNMQSIEDLAIVSGFGYDIEKKDKTKSVVTIEFISTEKKDEADTDYFVGKGNSIYSALENYKAKQDKPFTYGSELVYLISEERAKSGLEDIAYDLLSYPNVNITARTLICKGECKDYFDLELSSGSVSENLSKLIEFANEEYFFSKNYTVKDFLCMYHQQGRSLYLPYVEIIDKAPQLTGVVIFKDNKFFKKIPLTEAKLMNILRNHGGKGIITVTSDDFLKYLEFEGDSKLDINVSKTRGNLKYDIIVSVLGNLRIDTLKGNEFTKKEILKLEKILEDKLEKDLNNEVKKIQDVYGFDCLDLSKYAIAKYGKDSNSDSDECFCNAKINVDVKVKINSTGRIHKS